MTTHQKLAQMVTLLRQGPQTVDDLSALVDYDPRSLRRFMAALQAEGHCSPVGVKDAGARGSKPMQWEWR
jgi:predicted ArsR family transcriptional regulator